jgi:hypothetical protein
VRSDSRAGASAVGRWRAHCDGAFRYERPPTGRIRRRALSKSIWLPTADPRCSGSFIQTLVLTDIATGWTECAPLLVREQALPSTVLIEVRRQLPFSLEGIDTDDDSVFINETLKAYCEQANIVFTRCRPSRTTRRPSNRRTEPWSDEWSVIGISRGLRRLRCSLSAPVCELFSAVV